MAIFSDVIRKIQRSIEILSKAEGKLDENDVSFRTASGDVTIKTNAYRQLRRFYDYRLGRLNRPQPHRSAQYQKRKRKLGLKADFWTLVFEGVLYRSLRYEVKGGALYVVYDDLREDAMRGLKNLSGRNELLHPTKEEAKELAKAYFRSVIANFMQVWRKSA